MGFEEDAVAAFREAEEAQRQFAKENEEYRQRVIDLFDKEAKSRIRQWCEQIGVSPDQVDPKLTDFDDKEVKVPYTNTRRPNSSLTCRLSCSHSWRMEGHDFGSIFSDSVWFGSSGPILSGQTVNPISMAITLYGQPTSVIIYTKADIGAALLRERQAY